MKIVMHLQTIWLTCNSVIYWMLKQLKLNLNLFHMTEHQTDIDMLIIVFILLPERIIS